MPLEIEAHTRAGRPARGAAGPAAAARRGPILIGLINNMPDSALQSTETQFGGLLQAAAGPQAVKLRFSSLPELPRSPEALEHLARSYWPIDELLAEPPDALIVTGTEPRAPRLADEPYWQRLVQLLAWTEAHTIASVVVVSRGPCRGRNPRRYSAPAPGGKALRRVRAQHSRRDTRCWPGSARR